jgi:hypothetical protein
MMQDVHVELNPGSAGQKQHLTGRRRLNLSLRIKLVKFYIWSIAFYGVGTESRSEIHGKF